VASDIKVASLSLVASPGDAPNPENSPEQLREKAAAGDLDAMCQLGVWSFRGERVPKNERAAISCWRKASEHKHAESQNCLGYVFELGCGVKVDPIAAAGWYRKACEQGNVAGMVNYARCLAFGFGTPQNITEAMRWFHSAAKQGSDEARLLLEHAKNNRDFASGECFGFKDTTQNKLKRSAGLFLVGFSIILISGFCVRVGLDMRETSLALEAHGKVVTAKVHSMSWQDHSIAPSEDFRAQIEFVTEADNTQVSTEIELPDGYGRYIKNKDPFLVRHQNEGDKLEPIRVRYLPDNPHIARFEPSSNNFPLRLIGGVFGLLLGSSVIISVFSGKKVPAKQRKVGPVGPLA